MAHGHPSPLASKMISFSATMPAKLPLIFIVLLIFQSVTAGPLAYAACQTVCNAAAVKCYAAAGLTFGTITFGLGTPLVAIGCSAAQGLCMASICAPLLAAPTP